MRRLRDAPDHVSLHCNEPTLGQEKTYAYFLMLPSASNCLT